MPDTTQPHPLPLFGRGVSPHTALLLWLLLLLCYRLLVIAQPHLSLFYDEAYYYHWSLHPDWGYYSKPPMVAWLIALSTQLFGVSDFAVKLPAPILHTATAYLVYLIGQRLAGERTGILAAVAYSSAPLIGYGNLFITTDVPLFLFWALSLYLFIRALEEDSWRAWLLVGCAVGLGLMSKYTMVLLPAGLFLYLLFTPKQRTRLTSPRVWGGVLLAALIFSLNIYWNYRHGFVSFMHTREIAEADAMAGYANPLFAIGWQLLELAGFLTVQLLILGPFWSWVLFARRRQVVGCFRDRESWRLLLYAILPILIVIALQSFLSRAFANWAGPFIVGASILTGVALSLAGRRVLYAGLAVHLGLIALVAHWPLILERLPVEPTKKIDPYFRIKGWPQLAQQLKPLVEQYDQAILASNSRKLLAYMGYYAAPGESRLAEWNPDSRRIQDYYDLKYNLRLWQGSDQSFLFMSERVLPPAVTASFRQAELVGQLVQPVYINLERHLYVYHLTGFLGYATPD